MNLTIRKAAWIAMLVLGAGTAAVFAQGGPGYGPGYGGGPGYGPGMMGGWGPGYGPGYGPGMMGGGPGYGPGGGMLNALNLSDAQRDKIQTIQEEHFQKNWAAMGQMRSEMFKLRRMFNTDKVDANAVAEQQKKVDELRRQMLKSRIESYNQIEGVLTPEQRKQFRQFHPWWLPEAEG